MRWPTVCNVLVVMALVSACATVSSRAGELRAWGWSRDGQVTDAPAGGDYVAVAAGDAHGLALRSDGTVVAWGQNNDRQCEVPPGTYKAIGAGANFSLAIRTDGSIAAWGYDEQKQVSDVPAGYDFVAVDGGEFFGVALRANGSLVAWGNNRWGQVSNVPDERDFIAVVAGDDHVVALRSDGSLESWGYWAAVEETPTSGVYTAIAAGGDFSVALRGDGSLVSWGADAYGLDRVPAGNDYVGVSAGFLHALALKRDGSIVAWGAGTEISAHPHWGQAMPPTGNDYTAAAAGLYFSVALTGKGDPTEPKILADSFDGDSQSELWNLVGGDLLNCWLEERNQRLELVTTDRAQGAPAYYLGNAWRLDPASDFSFKVDYHYGPVTEEAGRVFVGMTPNVDNLEIRYVRFGAGGDRRSSYLWYETIDGKDIQIDFHDRRETGGVLYVSYDASLDELYLSSSGYGPWEAWVVIPGLLQTSWRGEPVVLFLGGTTEGLELKSGDVWLDHFVIETGRLEAESLDPISEVYRFWSPVLGRHFYTIDPAERDWIMQEWPEVWTYEGPAFKAATMPFQAGLAPVYRFWSPTGLSHFYTIDEDEKNLVIERYQHVWTFEGVAFYAYPEGAQSPDSMAVHRFWKHVDNSHFYTMDPAERDVVLREYPDIYTYEGVAFYAYRF